MEDLKNWQVLIEKVCKVWNEIALKLQSRLNIREFNELTVNLLSNSVGSSHSISFVDVNGLCLQNLSKTLVTAAIYPIDENYSLQYCISLTNKETNQSLCFGNAVIVAFCNAINDHVLPFHVGNCVQLFTVNESQLIQSICWNCGSTLIRNLLQYYGDEVALFSNIAAISSLTYESTVAKGLIIFNFDNQPELTVRFTNKIALHHSKATRKLLELTTPSIGLAVNQNMEIIGLCQADQLKYGWIRFRKQSKWEFGYKNISSNCFVVESQTTSGIDNGDLDQFKVIAKKTFREKVNHENLEILWNIIKTARQQKHGTLVAVCEDAKEETIRLYQQSSVLITPIQLVGSNLDLVSQFTAIDGALLVDLNGMCYGIGIVLDGIVSQRGDEPGRGSRYACSFQYVDKREKTEGLASIVVVISEDGPVNIVSPVHL